MAGDDEVAIRSNAGIDGEHLEAGEQLARGDIASGCLHERRPPQLATRLPADERVIGPRGGPEGLSCVDRSIKNHAAGRLVLRAVVERRGLIDDVGVVPRMPRGKAEVAHPGDVRLWRRAIEADMEQFVEGITIGQPRCPFLFGAEQVAVVVERQGDREADSGADRFAAREIGRDPLDRSALAMDVVGSLAIGVEEVGIGEVGDIESEIKAAVGAHRQACRVDVLRDLLPAGRDDALVVGDVVSVGVGKQRDLSLRGDEHADAVGIARRGEEEADRAAEAAGVVVVPGGRVFEAVAVGVAEEVDVAAIAERDERAVWAEADVVDVGKRYRNLADGEARHEHLDRRRVGDEFERRALCLGTIQGRGESRGERCVLGFEGRTDTRCLVDSECPVEEEDLCDVPFQAAANLLAPGAIGVVAGAEGELVEGQRPRGKRA